MPDYKNVAQAVFSRPWAITPEHYDVMCSIIQERMGAMLATDITIPESTVSNKFYQSLSGFNTTGFLQVEPSVNVKIDALFDNDEPEDSESNLNIVDGVAIIPIHGVITKRANYFSRWSGGASAEGLKLLLDEALANNSVDAIMFDIDSPGGSVDGSFDFADQIYEARKTKPIMGFANGLAASAGYLFLSACTQTMVNEVGEVGSIGVIMTHVDYSKWNKEVGKKVTYIFAGEYKSAGNQNEPLDRKSEAYLKGLVDETYSLFVDKVVRNQGMEQQAVIDTQAKVFIGETAKTLGLVDKVGNFDSALEQAVKLGTARRKRRQSVTNFVSI